MSITKKQLNHRNRLARQLLIAELRLSVQYTQQDSEYRRRVMDAADRLEHYALNCSAAHAQFLQLFRSGYDMIAICNTIPIQTSTYYAWRRSLLEVFGRYIGIEV